MSDLPLGIPVSSSALHPAQENIFFEQILCPQSPMYNLGVLTTCAQDYDSQILEQAWCLLYQNLDALRCVIQQPGDGDGQPQQTFEAASARPKRIEQLDFSDQLKPKVQADAWIQTQVDTCMDYLGGEASRVALIQLAPKQSLIYLQMHHVIVDAIGIYQLLQWLERLYVCCRDGLPKDWLFQAPQYLPAVKKSRSYLDSQRYQQDKTYWQRFLTEHKSYRLMPRTFESKAKNSNASEQGAISEPKQGAGELISPLPDKLIGKLQIFCHQYNLSPLTVLTSLVAMHFSGQSLQESMTFATTVHGRQGKKGMSVVGMHSNVLPFSFDLDLSDTFLALTSSVGKGLREGFRHSHFPSSHLSRLAGEGAQVLPDVQIMHEALEGLSTNDTPVKITKLRGQREPQPLLVKWLDYHEEGDLALSFTYAYRYFSDADITSVNQRLLYMLERCLTAPETRLINVDVLPEAERHTLLQVNDTSDTSDTRVPYSDNTTLQKLFEAQVEKTPDASALVFEQSHLSYRELNDCANRLALDIRVNYLERHGQIMLADTLIAVYLDRGLEMVISILAILKAGAAYVPISPEYPQERVQFIIEDTQAPILLSEQGYIAALDVCLNELTGDSPSLIPLDVVDLRKRCEAQSNQSNIPPINHAHHLAYVIYTSGTTGKPKGVMVTHQNVIHMAQAHLARFNLRECKRSLLFFPYVFDASVFELFTSLLGGLTAYICSENERKSLVAIEAIIARERIEFAALPPALLSAMSSSAQQESFNSLKVLFLGGESPSAEVLKFFSQHCQVFNAYGPTEITVCASVNRYQEGDLATNIGQALDNCHLYVLDGVGRLAPLGVPGELYVGGAGVTRGYLNRSDLTQERFVNNPFATRQDVAKGNTRLYKTGDLVRWITGAGSQRGSLEYLGRNDQQVKIRGHRIELGEVESALNNLPHVAQSVVIDVPHNGSLYLAAYIVGEPSAVSDDELSSDNLNSDNLNPDNLNIDNLNKKLSENLPAYMLPSTYTLIDTVPLTLNGKVNRRELPLPEFVLSTEYLAPKSELEKSLCVIWQEVLQRNKIGVNDNLFRIGGDSITAIRITAKIRRDFDADIELAQLFSQPTVAAIAGLISALAASGVRAEHELTNIPALALTRYPLSFAQERLLFVEQFEQGSSAYHIPFLTQLRDGVNLTLIEAAFNVIAERHPILKSVYRTDEHSQFYQEALSSKLSLRVQSVDNESALLSAVAQDISQPFDLSNEASMRLYLYSQKQEPQEQESQKQEPQEQESQGQDQQGQTHTLLVLWHHIAFDGWSMECFIQEFAQTYSDLCKAQPVALPELEISYGDYASWQRQNLAGDYLAKLTHYWKGQLCAYEPLSLPVDYARPAQQDYRGKNCYFALDRELSDNIRAFAKQQNTTLYTVLLSGFYLTLSKISGQNDILLGTPSDNRQHPQTQSLIGFFVNTLVLRAQLQPQASIEALVQQVHQLVIQAKAHQEMPFEKLVDALDLERDASRHPLYQVMFSVLGRNHDRDAMLDSPEWPFEQGELENNQDLYSPAKFDLSVYVNEGATQHPDSDKHCISGRFNYALSLFDDATISRMAAIYQRVLKAFVDPQCQDLCLSEVDVLSAEQRASLLNQPEELDYPHEATLHQLFEEQAENTPYATALVFERSEVFKCTSLSYRELNEKANQLAHEIRASYSRMFNKALPVDSFIGLYMDRSPEMVVGMLAILKAGAAYVPISPDYPEERVRYMLEDTQCSQVLSAGHLLQALEDKLNIKIQDGLELGLDPGLLQGLKNGLPQLLDVGDLVRHSDLGNTEVKPNNENPKNINHCTDLAYVLYTSGATGKPKGVLTPHRGVTSLVKNNTYATLSENDVFLQLSNPNFDATTLEVWSALLNGARLVVAPSKLSLSVESLHGLLSDYHVSVLWLTRALFDSLYVQKSDLFANLRYLLVGGEALTPSLIRQLVAQKDRPKHIINGYGSTESTTFTTTYDCDQFASLNIVNVPLGKAINTRQLYVLNTDMQLVPPGTPGELYVAGAGLARGYLNRPELTQERFVPNPFATEADKAKAYTNLYKTGDIVRYLVDANGFPGDLEYLGRNDSQVKIRGYRIELGEIENALNQLASVEHAAVIEREQAGSAYLAAYVVMQAGQVFDSEGLSQHLSLSLPDYMLPSTLTCLDALPLTINGKLDRRALPAPELVEQEKYTAPTSILEKTLCAIWQKVLSLPKIGLNDNFFRIGGNSISAIRLTAAIRSELKVDVTLAQLFSRPSVAGLCACLEEQSLDHKVLTKIPANSLARYPLSFAQERLIFIERFEQGTDAYHIPYFVKLREGVNLPALESAIKIIVDRHPILKTVYPMDDQGEFYQHVLAKDISLNTQNIPDNEGLLTEVKANIHRPFDLSCEPSIRVQHYQIGQDSYLLILWHHIAFDGWSTGCFTEDFGQAYTALCQGEAVVLPELEINYGDYALWQREALQGAYLEQLLQYWQEQLSAYESLRLPTDYPRPAQLDYQGKNCKFNLDAALSDQLRALAKHQQTTLYTVLLSGFYLTLAKLSGQSDIVVGTPSDNRQHAQTQSLIGFFVNSLVLRAQVDLDLSLDELIQQVHSLVTQAKIHQDLPFEKLVDRLNIERDASRHPLYQVMFSVNSPSMASEAVLKSDTWPFERKELAGDNDLYSPAKFDLSLYLSDAADGINGGIAGSVNFATSLFNESSILRMLGLYKRVLQSFADQNTPTQVKTQDQTPRKHQRIGDIQLLAASERRALLQQAPFSFYPDTSTLAQLFERQVRRNPNAQALVFQQNTLSYRELNDQAAQLACKIRVAYAQRCQQDMPADTLIALYFDRSLEMVISILAILKAGAAYVPISPEYPQERVKFIIEDTQAPMVLTQKKYQSHLDTFFSDLEISSFESNLLEKSMHERSPTTSTSSRRAKHNSSPSIVAVDSLDLSGKTLLEFPSRPRGLAYVIYTSGTTGKPKGVMITQQNVAHYTSAHIERFGLNQCQRALLFSAYVFDASVMELFSGLFSGLTLYMTCESERKNLAELGQLIQREQIDLAFLPPAILSALASDRSSSDDSSSERSLERQAFDCLKTVITGGEASTQAALEDFHQHARVFNAYGSTEITVCASSNEYRPGDGANNIGEPMNNTHIYILDASGGLVAMGAPGELYIGGAGLARGYLNQEALTEEKFVDNPFASDQDIAMGYTHLYKTGDIVRWLSDENGLPSRIEYLGRNDQQVKIRGFHIELAEIENAINTLPDVRQVTVIDRQQSIGAYLAAYIVVPEGKVLNVDSIKTHLQSSLPDYMLPRTFTQLSSLPMSINGKLDRRALPEPDLTSEADHYVAPSNQLQETLCTLWQELLGLDRVGLDDNFFDLGGHSLLLIKMQTRLSALIKQAVDVVDLFQYPTVSRLASHLAQVNDVDSLRASHELDSKFSKPSKSSKPEVVDREQNQDRAIAVIGFSGRFPGANNVDEFWQNLREGIDSLQTLSDEYLLQQGVSPELIQHPDYVKAARMLDGYDLFDADFFGYTPKEAEVIDPQQRLFLEGAWSGIEHAGYDVQHLNVPVGVFAGVGSNSYMLNNILPNPEIAEALGGYQLTLRGEKDFIASRTAYKLGLKGPALAIQTACSTSLVAIHIACQSLRQGECAMALAGGVSIALPQGQGYLYQEGMILSPDGRCRAFDAEACGTVGGSGVAVVVLKPLAQALDDGDSVHAVIRNSAINNDGMDKVGFTAPSVNGQSEVIQQAMAGLDYESIAYVEAHGTATPLGDPIEVAALTQAYRQQTQKSEYCALGSVKTNVGHLDAAAGATGFIKTVLALKHQEIPPSLHFNGANPQIDFANSPFFVNTALRPWPSSEQVNRAGVSSFGMGGTNAHVVLEAAPVQSSEAAKPWQLLCLSAKTSAALNRSCTQLAEYLDEHSELNLGDAAYTLNVGRQGFEHRGFAISQNPGAASETLQLAGQAEPLALNKQPQASNKWLQGSLNQTSNNLISSAQSSRALVFMFPGQGAQYQNMALDLYRDEPRFRDLVDDCAQRLTPHYGSDIKALLYPSLFPESTLTNEDINNTASAQVALFVTEYALAKLCLMWGLKPAAMIGHSIGEYVAACLAGVFSLDDALELVVLRGKLMQSMPAGSMLSVSMSKADLQVLLESLYLANTLARDELSIAAHNGPSHCVVSGSAGAVARLNLALDTQQITAKPLHTSHAFHSPMMAEILPAFRRHLETINLNPPTQAYISNVSGKWITVAQATSVQYWCDHLMQTVCFSGGLSSVLMRHSDCILLELGPGRALSSLARQQFNPQSSICTRDQTEPSRSLAFNALRTASAAENDQAFILKMLGQLWLQGVVIDWAAFHGDQQRLRIPLPTYSFERQRHWIEPVKPVEAATQNLANTATGTISAIKTPEQKLPREKWLNVPCWQSTAPVRFLPDAKTLEISRWLIFCDGQGLGEQLFTGLLAKDADITRRDIIRVRPGSVFSCETTDDDESSIYTIRPDSADDYQRLFQALEQSNQLPEGVIHLWGLDADRALNTKPEALDTNLAYGFYSLLFLAQHWPEQARDRQLLVLTDQAHSVIGNELIRPASATLIGLVQTLVSEYPDIQARALDVLVDSTAVVEQVLAECGIALKDNLVAYRGKQRSVRAYDAIQLPPSKGEALRQNGVYLVTGGLGGLGLSLASYLAKAVQAKLILLGRSAFPERKYWDDWITVHGEQELTSQKIRKIRALETLGAEVLVLTGDVSQREEMQAIIAQAQNQYGSIHGVIHTAGVPAGGMMAVKTQQEVEHVLAAKVRGSVNLVELLDAKNLDFIVFYSSLNALMSVPGQVDYCAANAFLDSYAHGLAHQGVNAISINWDGWQEVGMAANVQLPASLKADYLNKLQSVGILPEEGAAVFADIIENPLPQVVLSTVELSGRLYAAPKPAQAVQTDNVQTESVQAERAQTEQDKNTSTIGTKNYPVNNSPENNSPTNNSRQGLSATYAPASSETEGVLLDIWYSSLGVEGMGIHDDFFELGGHSLLMTQLISRYQQMFSIKLPMQMLFEAPTVAKLSQQIDQLLAARQQLQAPVMQVDSVEDEFEEFEI